MKKVIKFSIPIVLILITYYIVNTILSNPPKAKKGWVSKEKTKLLVEVKPIEKMTYDIWLDSYGVTQSSVKSQLSSQVSGKVVYISEDLKNGAFIKKGELLLQIEDEDYKVDLQIAKAKLVLAQQSLVEEEAKVKQAKEDWYKFNTAKANALVLRKPQLESAKANVLVAKSDLQKAQLKLNRTKIYAPYNGRVVEKNVSISEVISSNTKIASISSSETMELRLPIRNSDLKYIDLTKKNKVSFYSSINDKKYTGEIVRSESSIDTNTKQLYLIAQIKKGAKELRLGEYLKAKISAKKLQNVLLIPNSAIYQGAYVYIEKDGIIIRRQIDISWQDEKDALISKGLSEGENIVLTTLGLVNSGTKVKVLNAKNSDTRRNK